MNNLPQGAIVFGASGAIGSALCRRLSQQGVRLVLVGRSHDRLNSLAAGLPGAFTLECDVTDPKQVASVIDQAQELLGAVTQVAHCVGSIVLKAAHQLRDEDWNEVITLNLTSCFYVLRATVALWNRQSSPGSIVFCSSAAASVGLAHHEAIGAAKAGVEGLVRSAAATYASRGIRINAVAPGLVRTSLSSRITASESALKASLAMHPIHRLGEPDDVASALSWFLQPEQGWVTGQILGVDGGLSRLKTLN